MSRGKRLSAAETNKVMLRVDSYISTNETIPKDSQSASLFAEALQLVLLVSGLPMVCKTPLTKHDSRS